MQGMQNVGSMFVQICFALFKTKNYMQEIVILNETLLSSRAGSCMGIFALLNQIMLVIKLCFFGTIFF